jgi:hypothetical protein
MLFVRNLGREGIKTAVFTSLYGSLRKRKMQTASGREVF